MLRSRVADQRPNGREITRQCSGPSRRVSFLWFESRRGAGSATDRHYVRGQNAMDVSQARQAIRDETASFVQHVMASAILMSSGDSTLEDLLACLRWRGLPA